MTVQAFGRVSRPPHPVLFQLIYEPDFLADQRHVLPHLLRVDAAHVVMLADQRILPGETAAALLAVNDALRARVAAGETVFEPPASHRGMYIVYEAEYIRRLGGELGGAAHVARSRNDINATITRMRVRDELLGALRECGELTAALRVRALEHVETVMSGFTHLQPAQPSTLGHYLAAVMSELVRTTAWLADCYPVINRSPMGAAAGIGTSFPVDRLQVAHLLGFAEPIANSIDAVGSRDYVVHVLGGLALLGTTLTRLATDLQAWASAAYGFVAWPDELVSTSSIMPQKRNAFVLENVRGQAVQATGALMNALMGLKNVPYTNSIEVSAEVSAHIYPALRSTRKAVRLMTLLIANLEVRPERMRGFLRGADTTMTALADFLVARHGLAFRAAHDAVSALVARKPDGAELSPADVQAGLADLIGARLDAAELAGVLEPERCVRAARFGGGPAPDAVRAQLDALASHDISPRLAAWCRELADSEALLARSIASTRARVA
ncbi:MAG TPA: argininosuccinate lyase [Kofleriaceae bacterium]|jgi:argininosuccinate lyase|nr:argininosuccinate lyase [Kofleriaceae bacterium]